MYALDGNDPSSKQKIVVVVVAVVKMLLFNKASLYCYTIVGHVSFRSVKFSSGGWMARFNCFKTALVLALPLPTSLLSIYDIYMKLFWTQTNTFSVLWFQKWAHMCNFFYMAISIDMGSMYTHCSRLFW